MSVPLLIYCIVSASVYLLLVSALLLVIENRLKLAMSIPEELREKTGFGWFMTNFIMEALFYVAIPSMAYSFFYIIFPLEGFRAGIAVALIAFTMGAVPFTMALSLRIKLSSAYVTFLLMGTLVKLGGSLAIIGYLYSL